MLHLKSILFKSTSYLFKNIIVVVALLLGISMTIAWSPPTQTPPLGNVEPPLNASNNNQTKTGDITLWNLNAGGNISSLGTITSPQFCIGGACISAWPSGGSGGASTPVPSFMVNKNNVSQTGMPAALTLLTWSNEVFDTNNNFANNRFTPTVAGKYYVTATALCGSLSTNSFCEVQIRKNGAEIVLVEHAGNTLIQPSAVATILVDMNGSTDYLEVFAYPDNGQVYGNNSYTYFTGTLIPTTSGGGGGATTINPGFSVNKGGTNQNISPNTETLLTWSNEVFDTNNNFANNKFTPTVAGKYLIKLSTYCDDGTYCAAYIKKNTNTYLTNFNGIGTIIVDMNGTTDYVEGYVRNAGGSTINGGPSETNFTGMLLPATSGGGGTTSGIGGIFAATTSGTFTVPAGVTKIKVIVTGGGGGGSPGNGQDLNRGGGGGGTCIKYISVTPGQQIPFVVGAGGAESGNFNYGIGYPGGTSSFGNYCSATGGGSSNTNYNTQPGVGIGGDLNIQGSGGSAWNPTDGAPPTNITANAKGGSSYWGAGGGTHNYGYYGVGGGQYGGGGDGGTYSGGGGGTGVVVVEW